MKFVQAIKAKRSAFVAPAIMAMMLGVAGCSGSTDDALDAKGGQDAQLALASGGGDLQQVADLPPPDNTSGGSDQLISANDLLEVDVFQVDDLDRTTRVDSRGSITLPLIGQIRAAGRTVSELEADIERRYGASYLQNPDITIFMKESAGQRVTVDGEVKKAGIFPTDSNSTLLEIVSQAGGFTDLADPSKIYVFREYGKKKLVANYSVTSIRTGKSKDPRVFGGDTIVVFQSKSKVTMRNLRDGLNIAGGLARLATPF